MKSNKTIFYLLLLVGFALSSCSQTRYGHRMVRSHGDYAKAPVSQKKKADKAVEATPLTEIVSEEVVEELEITPEVGPVVNNAVAEAEVIAERPTKVESAIDALTSEKNVFVSKRVKKQAQKLKEKTVSASPNAVEKGGLIWWVLVIILVLLVLRLLRELLGPLYWVINVILLIILIWILLVVLGMI